MAPLKPLPNFSKRPGPVVVIIMDGVGIGKEDDGNAVYLANPQNLNSLIKKAKEQNLYTNLKAHGPAVGLPSEDDMGNSEVGHNALGAGQVYAQGAKLVNQSLENGSFFKTDVWSQMIKETANEKKCLHFIGLLSDGNVHSHIEQLFAIMEGSIRDGIKKIRVHPLLDGRDVPPDSGLIFIDQLEEKLNDLEQRGIDAKIASGGGRMHLTMDRYDADWTMVKRGWDVHVEGIVPQEDITPEYKGYYTNAKEAIELARKLFPSKMDQFNPSFVIVDDHGNPVGKIKDGDAVINFNFRGDRAIEISKAFELEKFTYFKRDVWPKVRYAGLLEYDGDAHIPKNFLVPPPAIKNVSGQYLAQLGLKTFAIAETHKFGHVTYFWNGNKSGYIDQNLETYIEVPSDPAEEVEAKPDMKAREVTEKLIEAINSDKYDLIRVNFANGDMVGHTGNIKACIQSIKTLDECLGKIMKVIEDKKAVALVTADHGNCEEELKKGKMSTSHSLNPVPFFIVDPLYKGEYQVDVSLINEPGIANVTATFINMLGLEAPQDYCPSLIKF